MSSLPINTASGAGSTFNPAAGPNSSNLSAQTKQAHPIDHLQQVTAANKQHGGSHDLDLDAVRRLYGSGLAMTLATERKLAAHAGGRLPGLEAAPNSNAMLDAVTGNDLEFGFDDVLNLRENSPYEVNANQMYHSVHARMEAKFGL
mmetsp:Transcript_28399/g.41796  ORF Transcript_28399/g.41796 Transcript_28399/m.41796 type:complete len:146 (-) Transcript_28399:140-577(-)|eukprot:CAMPEP_0116027240 /NCGR_PEP_ID=MMETSP0321-20121206/14492_1 /TAXON_ID=163516 /ORGANISM="Leptocylindrus danicus var. danicus, Strain B650" /LENGTH=145 /DNA_ID=CAMNT_0003500519 /DNA_START=31 /DNA_END=468 /DNA_ORIENTATION=-